MQLSPWCHHLHPCPQSWRQRRCHYPCLNYDNATISAYVPNYDNAVNTPDPTTIALPSLSLSLNMTVMIPLSLFPNTIPIVNDHSPDQDWDYNYGHADNDHYGGRITSRQAWYSNKTGRWQGEGNRYWIIKAYGKAAVYNRCEVEWKQTGHIRQMTDIDAQCSKARQQVMTIVNTRLPWFFQSIIFQISNKCTT